MELEQPGGLQPGHGVCRKRKRESISPPCSEKARELNFAAEMWNRGC